MQITAHSLCRHKQLEPHRLGLLWSQEKLHDDLSGDHVVSLCHLQQETDIEGTIETFVFLKHLIITVARSPPRQTPSPRW